MLDSEMEPDLKIVFGLLSLVCLMWVGGIWFICSFYKCDHDCIYCGDSAEDCPFCRKGDDTLPGEEMDRIAEEMKKAAAPISRDESGKPFYIRHNTQAQATQPALQNDEIR